MFDVGLATALEKPLILLASGSRAIPFGLAGVEVFIYGPLESDAEVSKNKLKTLIIDRLSKPEGRSLVRSAVNDGLRKHVFVSYSHVDLQYLNRLLIHLRPLERDGLIEIWADTRLRAGDLWKQEVEKALRRSAVAVLIISPDFLASEFIINNELPLLLQNEEQRGVRIVPIVVKPCRFARDNKLKQFQSVNDPKEPLILMPEGIQEQVYDQVALEVEQCLLQIG